jgi:hypothetical protein
MLSGSRSPLTLFIISYSPARVQMRGRIAWLITQLTRFESINCRWRLSGMEFVVRRIIALYKNRHNAC